jgi:hypothetical protein
MGFCTLGRDQSDDEVLDPTVESAAGFACRVSRKHLFLLI